MVPPSKELLGIPAQSSVTDKDISYALNYVNQLNGVPAIHDVPILLAFKDYATLYNRAVKVGVTGAEVMTLQELAAALYIANWLLIK